MINLHKKAHEFSAPGDKKIKVESGGFTIKLGKTAFVWSTPLSVTFFQNGRKKKLKILNINCIISIGLTAISVAAVMIVYGRKNG